MQFRDATIEDLNYFINHPAISEACGVPKGRIVDMSHAMDGHRAVGFTAIPNDVNGVLLFGCLEDAVFDAHFVFLPGGSGKALLSVCKEMLNEMFTNRGARVIKGYPPRGNRAVRLVGTSLGFTKTPNKVITNSLGMVCDEYILRR